MIKTLKNCIVCGNSKLISVLNLGKQPLSGIFPFADEQVPEAPLELVRCNSKDCGHVQLQHTFSPSILYGSGYGYRSGLNSSMVKHLKGRVDEILGRFSVNAKAELLDSDVVLDIAGNDGTTLSFYPMSFRRINIDPTSRKFEKFQPKNAYIVPELFSKAAFLKAFAVEKSAIVDRANLYSDTPKAKIVTAFSMFYDLDHPYNFLLDVKEILHDDGLFVLEQSYMPAMFKQISYDTICHEHLSYFGLKQLKLLLDSTGLKIVDVSFNDCNGGSFVVTIAKQESECWDSNIQLVNKILQQESSILFENSKTWEQWSIKINKTRTDLINSLSGKRVAGIGASTKGNVILQFCDLGPEEIEVIGDVNPEKHGRCTPGNLIPITDEDSVLNQNFDTYLVLPWHFKNFFLESDKFKGKTLLFPLPEVHTVKII